MADSKEDVEDGLIHAYRMDGLGGGKSLGWDEIGDAMSPQDEWVHLLLGGGRTAEWLAAKSGLDEAAYEALLAEDPRPRCEPHGEGVLLILRGVDLSPGAEREEMISLRLWADKDRVISVRSRRMMVPTQIRTDLDRGIGPKTSGELVALLAERISDQMEPVLADIEDRIDLLEETIVTEHGSEAQQQLGEVRRDAVALRRYLAPQRVAVSRLREMKANWLEPGERQDLREIADRVTRYVEDLDAVRERAQVMNDEIAGQVAQQLNRTIYVLSVVGATFLPLTFLTGLLGINVAGIPGAESPWSFHVVAAVLAVLGFLEYLVLRRLKLI